MESNIYSKKYSKVSDLISVIIPIYNSEKYLYRCIDSILKQTYRDFELILIDDGSVDKSGIICDEYAQKDKRIKAIHQSNMGVSNARQRGLNIAKGEYIIQFDSDDWVEPNCLKDLYDTAILYDADMVICDIYLNTINRQEYSKQGYTNLTAKLLLNDIINQRLHGSLTNKLIRSSCIKQYNIQIPEKLILSEDLYFCCSLLRHNISVIYLPKAFYHYQLNKNSLTNSCSEKSFESKKILIEEISKILPSKEYNNFFALKKTAIWDAFFSKTFEAIPTTYPEIHSILRVQRYNWLNPLAGCIALAIKGYPKIAHKLYNINILLLNYLKKIKSHLKHA